MEEKAILQAKELNIGYEGKNTNVIARNVNIALQSGKLTALIGANGIGKSTLLRTLTGMQKPLGGQVYLNGKSLQEYPHGELAQNLAVVLTESLPPSNLTVFELVALGRQPYTNWLGTMTPEDTVKVNEAMQQVQVNHLAHKKHYEISDGQLQKALIARALAQDTPLIILDEPTTHLDLMHKVSLIRLLRKLTSETGKSILYSTHDLDLALQLSDELIVMSPGNIAQGSPGNLISNNVFDSLFNDASIRFDATKGGFIIDK